MRFISMHKNSANDETGAPPSPELVQNMGALIGAMIQAGVFEDTAGLVPSRARVRLQFQSGRCTVTHGPYVGGNELVSTLLIPDGGEIRVFGQDVRRDERVVRRMINRVSVEASFFKKLSALENLMYAARLYDMPVGAARQRAIYILRKLGMSEKRLYEPLENMSRGMQQKVAIARGLVTAPVLLLLDEPTTGLDPRSKREVQQFVLDLRARHDATVVLTTHDMDEADRLCDRIAVIDNGKIIAQDTPAGLKHLVAPDGGASLEDVFMKLTGRSLTDSDEMEEDKEDREAAEPAAVG